MQLKRERGGQGENKRSFDHLKETAQMQRLGAVQGKTVKEFLTDKIHELLLDSNVGAPLINSPSFGRKKISDPSNSFGRSV